MFDIRVNTGDISISSIEREDILLIQNWINSQSSSYKEKEEHYGLKEFYEKFLEYYVNESEFFLKINKENKIIGVIKGRIEFKSYNEVWLGYFLLDSELRRKGIGSSVIQSLKKYFSNGLGINSFYTGVCENDIEVLKFWNCNGFKLSRISKGFFEGMDMLVLKSEL